MPGKTRNNIKSVPVYLLLISVSLRSLVAPGYMLDTGTPDNPGLTVTLCAGLNGINVIPGVLDMDSSHGKDHPHPGHFVQHDSSDSDNDHETQHFTAACGLWSASGTFITTASEVDVWVRVERSHIDVHPVMVFVPERNYPSNPARAPPVPPFSLT